MVTLATTSSLDPQEQEAANQHTERLILAEAIDVTSQQCPQYRGVHCHATPCTGRD